MAGERRSSPSRYTGRALAPAHVDLFADRALVVAPFGEVETHFHSAAALVIGLDGYFLLRTGMRWQPQRAIVVPPGYAHQIDCGATVMAVLYAPPGLCAYQSICTARAVPPNQRIHPIHVSISEREMLLRIHAGELQPQQAFTFLYGITGATSGRHVDARLGKAAALIAHELQEPPALRDVSASVGLSESRLQHLFQREIGLTPRELRRWHRMQAVARAVAEGDNLTTAAHRAGFTDSAHLTRAFHSAFGVQPSRIFSRGSRVRHGLPAEVFSS